MVHADDPMAPTHGKVLFRVPVAAGHAAAVGLEDVRAYLVDDTGALFAYLLQSLLERERGYNSVGC